MASRGEKIRAKGCSYPALCLAGLSGAAEKVTGQGQGYFCRPRRPDGGAGPAGSGTAQHETHDFIR